MLLRVEKVTKAFDGFVAVQDVDLSITQGQMACIIGPNGAGKSTIFNLITGHLQPTRGKIFFHDRNITGLPPYTICQLGMGRSFQRTNIFPRLSVFDNVQVAVLAHRKKTLNFFTPSKKLVQDETYAVLAQVGLADEAQSISGMLSYGFQKQLELGIALASEPALLLLDEPTAGMSPQETANAIAAEERHAFAFVHFQGDTKQNLTEAIRRIQITDCQDHAVSPRYTRCTSELLRTSAGVPSASTWP